MARAEELLAMQFGLHALPIDATGLGPQLDAEPLQRLIEFSNGFLFVDAFVALQSLNTRICSLSNGVGELSFAASGGPLQ